VEFIIPDQASLPEIVKQVVAQWGERSVVAVSGAMGAGKTTFIAECCRLLGIESGVCSPTFSLVNEYAYRDAEGKLRLVRHLDLYRLISEGEVAELGFDDLLEESDYCFIEWPELAASLLPVETVKIRLELWGENGGRRLILEV
jgi:tRNA threonylcarbamoyladenosine biosynthesis protein TsaE